MDLCLWIIVFTSISAAFSENDRLFVKYGPPNMDPLHMDCFFHVPRMRSVAEAEGWSVAEDRLATDGVAVLCRHNDYRVCILTDMKGSIAGMQISMSVEDVKRAATPYPMEPNPMQETKTVLGTEVYAATVLFVEQDVLKSGGRLMTPETQTAPGGMYFMRRDGQPRFVPNSEDHLEMTLYRKQACTPAMGRHYLYNLTSEYDCSDAETFYPFYDEMTHQLAGVGYMAFGRSSWQHNGRHWFEITAGANVNKIFPDAPVCLENWVDSYGVTSLHIYVHREPWKLHC